MEIVNYGITENDIINYLNKHSKDALIQFREALFVKYIKHQDIFSIEKIEMLANKINRTNINVNSVCDYHVDLGRIPSYVPSFIDYIRNQEVDTSAYMHILIPILGLYKEERKNITLTNGHVEKYLPTDLTDYDCGILTDTIDNYTVAGKIRVNEEEITRIGDIKMSKNECNIEISAYEEIYGKKEVEKIKKLVREDLK